jgi:hypothetical protein
MGDDVERDWTTEKNDWEVIVSGKAISRRETIKKR